MVTEDALEKNLQRAVAASRTPLTLCISKADQTNSYGELVHVALLAQTAGFQDVLLAAQPRIVSAPNSP